MDITDSLYEVLSKHYTNKSHKSLGSELEFITEATSQSSDSHPFFYYLYPKETF